MAAAEPKLGPVLWEATLKSPGDLPPLCHDFLQAMREPLALEPWILALEGPMGAGKTTFAGGLLHALGLSAKFAVQSPTYTLMQEYQVAHKSYAHLDLYRAGEDFSLRELGVLDARAYSGILVEWWQAPPESQRLEPDFILTIAPKPSQARHLSLRSMT